ncbi:MAG: hypothetical protein ACI81V_000904 [Lentimonas sp.]|jgi:hypothetical protein
MKKFILITGLLLLLTALGLRGYFAFVPPPEPTLERPLAEIVPHELAGWTIEDMDMADSPESSARISEFLNFDDALFRVFKKGDTFIGLYIAYWKPGKASYRWAGAHTPDTCWVVNGWTCDEREYRVPFKNKEHPFEPAEYGIYSKGGSSQNVYFWHLVGGFAQNYVQTKVPNIFSAWIDIKDHGLSLRKEQFFVRLSSNRSLKALKSEKEFHEILDSMLQLGMHLKTTAPE